MVIELLPGPGGSDILQTGKGMRMSAVDQKSTAKAPRIALTRNELRSEHIAGPHIPWRRMGIYAALAIGFFLLRAVPMLMRSRENVVQRVSMQRELAWSQMENRLSEAVIDARRGDYEPARQTASDFFTALRNQLDNRTDTATSAAQRADLTSLLAQRDDIITLLARSDPAAADRLSNLYVAYRRTMSGVQPQNGRAS